MRAGRCGASPSLFARWLQRQKRMPHGSSDLDFELAQLVTQRLQSAAGQYVFSYSAQNAEGVCRPSTLLDLTEITPAKSVRVSLGEDGEYGLSMICKKFSTTRSRRRSFPGQWGRMLEDQRS